MNDAIKRDNRKALPLFLLVILAAALVGGVLGFAVGWFGHSDLPGSAREGMRQLLHLISPWGIPVCDAVLLGAGWVIYRRLRRGLAAWDGEDEAFPDLADRRICQCQLLLLAALLINFALLSVATAGIYRPGEMEPVWIVLAYAAAFPPLLLLQQKLVDLTRRISPEKQGSVYDLRFNRKWRESCDEAELQEMGRAAYRSYQVTVAFCPILWLVMLLINQMFATGLLPSLAVLAVWGCLQGSYILSCIRKG